METPPDDASFVKHVVDTVEKVTGKTDFCTLLERAEIYRDNWTLLCTSNGLFILNGLSAMVRENLSQEVGIPGESYTHQTEVRVCV